MSSELGMRKAGYSISPFTAHLSYKFPEPQSATLEIMMSRVAETYYQASTPLM